MGDLTPSKRAREIADEHGLDLAAIEGSGAGGRVVVADVRAAAAAAENGQPRGPYPAGMDPRGQGIWDDVRNYLVERELWEEVFGNLLERYIGNVLHALDMRSRAEQKPIVNGSKGQPVPNPALKMARAAEQDAHKYAEALLLSPASLRQHLGEGKGGGGDGIEDLGF